MAAFIKNFRIGLKPKKFLVPLAKDSIFTSKREVFVENLPLIYE
jgi:hypothetical protein